MPLLSSGRHVAVEPVDLAEFVKFGTDVQVLAFITAYRLQVREPRDIANAFPVFYFKDGEGIPPNAPTYPSGYSVAEVLAGDAGWTEQEISDFTKWLADDPALNCLLRETFNEVHQAIVASPLWDSELMTDEPERGLRN